MFESTTPDLVALTRQGYDGLKNGDIDATLSTYASGAVYDMSEAGLGIFEGVEAIRGLFEDWQSSFEDRVVEVEAILDLGDGVVFSAWRETARPAGSGSRVEQRRGLVVVWAGGKAEWLKAYLDIDEARAAAERLAQERADG